MFEIAHVVRRNSAEFARLRAEAVAARIHLTHIPGEDRETEIEKVWERYDLRPAAIRVGRTEDGVYVLAHKDMPVFWTLTLAAPAPDAEAA